MIRDRLLRLVALVVVGSIAIAACGSDAAPPAGSDAASLAGYERSPEPTVGHVSLPAVNRNNVDFAFHAESGQLLLVFFGFASCPDICPTTLADARLALAELGDRADDVNLAFVTIDPDRDTPQIATAYVEAFIEGSIALRSEDADELARTADAFGVTYSVIENDAGDVEVGHTPNLFVVDDRGALILTWPFGVPSPDMTSDLNILLDRLLDPRT